MNWGGVLLFLYLEHGDPKTVLAITPSHFETRCDCEVMSEYIAEQVQLKHPIFIGAHISCAPRYDA